MVLHYNHQQMHHKIITVEFQAMQYFEKYRRIKESYQQDNDYFLTNLTWKAFQEGFPLSLWDLGLFELLYCSGTVFSKIHWLLVRMSGNCIVFFNKHKLKIIQIMVSIYTMILTASVLEIHQAEKLEMA